MQHSPHIVKLQTKNPWLLVLALPLILFVLVAFGIFLMTTLLFSRKKTPRVNRAPARSQVGPTPATPGDVIDAEFTRVREAEIPSGAKAQ